MEQMMGVEIPVCLLVATEVSSIRLAEILWNKILDFPKCAKRSDCNSDFKNKIKPRFNTFHPPTPDRINYVNMVQLLFQVAYFDTDMLHHYQRNMKLVIS